MDDQNKNLILAMVLSSLVLVIWFILFPPEQPHPQPDNTASTSAAGQTAQPDTAAQPATGTASAQPEGAAPSAAATQPQAPRIEIDSPSLKGSLSLAGGRIDTLLLKDYKVSLQDPAKVELLNPVGSEHPYYVVFGWTPGGDLTAGDVPGPDTLWTKESGDKLTPSTPVTLRWDNGKGLVFRRTLSLNDRFMFTVAQSVENKTGAPVRLAPYGLIARVGMPGGLSGYFVIHEGAMRMSDGILGSYDFTYKKMRGLSADDRWGGHASVEEVKDAGWLGFTDHYWMTTLIPERGQPFSSVVQYVEATDTYRTVARMDTVEVAPGAVSGATTQVFAGAKEWDTIRNYEAGRRISGFVASVRYAILGKADGIPRFTDSIEWGWYYFLTKPIFLVLHELRALIGNMGIAIIALTLFIKALLFPLARKSYVSMAKMKELQPEMEKIKERAGDDRQKLQGEMMALYKKEKVNPASGCLPILLQIPIFFSLYKVIFVTLELRQASFFGPFQDLSAPDPTSLYNLFGLLPWASPEPHTLLATIFIGVLPILLGCSMWLQQKLNPAPTDPTQAMIFAWMPWIFMFMLGTFPSGLVVYWIGNNTITFSQQYIIMRSHGYHPDIWGNIRGGPKKAAAAAANNPGKPAQKPASKSSGKPKK